MSDFQILPQPFVHNGLDLSVPIDRLDDGRYAIADNVRSYTRRQIEGRPGLSAPINSAPLDQLSIHSIKRLNDPIGGASQTFARLIGSGTKLYSDASNHTTYSSRATGFSGDPLQFVPHRPNQSLEAWMYIANSSKMGKLKVDGTFYNMGISPPNQPPVAQIAPLQYKIISDFEATTGWTPTGTAGAISTPTRINTTITYILYDTGSTGWACVNPTAMDDALQEGIFLTINTGGGTQETILVDSTFQPITSTTIGSISYDSGSTGPCSIQPATSSEGLDRDSMIRINDGGGSAENVRVTDVIMGPDGVASFRCSTINTHSATETLTGLRSFRANFSNSHSPAETIITHSFESTISTGVGNLDFSGALDLSTIPLIGGGSRPTQPTDILHLSIKMDNPSNLVEFKIYLDFDSTTNDFSHNYFLFTASPNDFQPVASGQLTTVTTRQKALQTTFINTTPLEFPGPDLTQLPFRQFGPLPIDSVPFDGSPDSSLNPTPPSNPIISPTQVTAGSNQWSELSFNVSDLGRFGSDSTRGLANIAALRLQINCTSSITLDVDAWWIGGTLGPDYTGGSTYQYSYVARSAEGAQSNPSPPIRVGVQPVRQAVQISLSQHSDPQVTKLDVYRLGGTLLNWYYVGTTPNSATPLFTDTLPDSTVLAEGVLLQFDRFQPFPSIDTYKSGTCNVSGTTVTWASGDHFNPSWSRNTVININGITYTLYNSPASTTTLFLNENGGTQSSVPFEIKSPTILQQNVSAMWGPWGGGESAIYFFALDPNRPGVVMWTNPNDPDSASDANFLEITSPSDPLLNGCLYNQRIYTLSSEDMWEIVPNFTSLQQQLAQQLLPGQSLFLANQVPLGRGLFSRYALCVGDFIYFLSRDGIYRTTGQGGAECITLDLAPLFPHDGQPGRTINGINPPDLTQTNFLRLEYGNGLLRFWYKDTGGILRCLVRDCISNIWLSRDYFTPTCSISYTEEGTALNSTLYGGQDGNLYQLSGTSDNSSHIAGELRTKSVNAGSDRYMKDVGDAFIDLNTSSANFIAVFGINQFSSLTPGITVNTPSRSPVVLDLVAGGGLECIDISLDLTWSTTQPFQLIEWSPSLYLRPELSQERATDYTDAERVGAKFMQGVWIEADTGGSDKQVLVEFDGGQVGATLTINHLGKQLKSYPFPTPFYAKLVRLHPSTPTQWELYPKVTKWEFNSAPDLCTTYITPPTTNGVKGFQHIPECWIALIGATSDITFTPTFDGIPSSPLIIPHNSGLEQKVRVILPATKFKYVSYSFTSSSGFRLNKEACEVRVKQWDGQQDQILQMFGDIAFDQGALI